MYERLHPNPRRGQIDVDELAELILRPAQIGLGEIGAAKSSATQVGVTQVDARQLRLEGGVVRKVCAKLQARQFGNDDRCRPRFKEQGRDKVGHGR